MVSSPGGLIKVKKWGKGAVADRCHAQAGKFVPAKAGHGRVWERVGEMAILGREDGQRSGSDLGRGSRLYSNPNFWPD